MVIGLPRLQTILDYYKGFCNYHRPHQGIGNKVPFVNDQEKVNFRFMDRIQKNQLFGGLLNSYHRVA